MNLSKGIVYEMVDEIVKDISDRRSLKWEWSHIDNNVQGEIKQKWNDIISNVLERYVNLL